MNEKELPLFYCPGAGQGGTVLDAAESRHAVQVLRLHAGDPIGLVDGRGGFYEALITRASARACGFDIVRAIPLPPRSYRLTLAIAPTRNVDRFSWFLEKAVELGIDEIVPVVCRHAVRTRLPVERMRKVMVSALKQSRHAVLPVLHEPLPFPEVVSRTPAGPAFLCTQDAPLLTHVPGLIRDAIDLFFMIGPEGDFSTDEKQLAEKHGLTLLSLGAMRLRTETAGVHVCAFVNFVKTFYPKPQ